MPITSHLRDPDSLDAALVACVGGDANAFAPVYEALAPAAFGAALSVLRDREHAAEVTQEVMVEVWQTASRFDATRGGARTWVVTLARRRAIDRVRSEQARRTRDQRDLDTRVATDGHDVVGESVEALIQASAVRDCLASLTAIQRDAVVRAYYGGLTYREVAEQLDVGLATVKARIRDGLLRLRTCLGGSRG